MPVPPLEGGQGTPTSSLDHPLEAHDVAGSNDEPGVGLAVGEGESITPPCIDLESIFVELDLPPGDPTFEVLGATGSDSALESAAGMIQDRSPQTRSVDLED